MSDPYHDPRVHDPRFHDPRVSILRVDGHSRWLKSGAQCRQAAFPMPYGHLRMWRRVPKPEGGVGRCRTGAALSLWGFTCYGIYTALCMITYFARYQGVS